MNMSFGGPPFNPLQGPRSPEGNNNSSMGGKIQASKLGTKTIRSLGYLIITGCILI